MIAESFPRVVQGYNNFKHRTEWSVQGLPIPPKIKNSPFPSALRGSIAAAEIKTTHLNAAMGESPESIHGKLAQGANNCGPASLWVIEERAKQKSLSRNQAMKKIREMDTGGFHSYRSQMLDELHRSMPDKYQSGTYPEAWGWPLDWSETKASPQPLEIRGSYTRVSSFEEGTRRTSTPSETSRLRSWAHLGIQPCLYHRRHACDHRRHEHPTFRC